MATIFTKIINREIPANIVYENDKVIAFKDINPAAPIHILVVPKKEIATINDIQAEDRELIGEMYLAIGKIVKDLGIDKEGYRIITNCNEFGGQEVFHLHFHILGGKRLGALLAD
ncbi:histidine triad nucleotide-binding protein [Fusobacterium mortiferum]|jgi:histidine triad (HIT) family protein|uniref:Histidine triad nucleotide-binding protein n=2 Tax=Fusobacterium TaxID=848 RepID=A0ABS2G1Z8_FUSMR|nr:MULTISPECIES: histidine triad nucleotide-binding protein [Fusobacterium]MBU3841965.1 histidine triad nucleotide-binding protein [Candidatus Fusobacterium pullicola]MBM6690138.1 histidine triad nucleotide-binding protein [Fusobacterium mortiferum]MBM6822203.1 histidine triad nucleotide-binding protein [Fusobacterium mortiferum]MBM6874780.1 histidine triad nucleotide-binding protein [Fusobacterium mortiferum]MDO5789461.1 histidine triad nucleotide-binding protein [Fusobacterium sp.]